MKINWGTAIVIAMALFMIFILQFVYRTLADDKYNHELVSEDYYKDELYYQEEIDKLNNANQLTENVKIERIKKGFLVTFPNDMDYKNISGKIYLQRPSDENLDLEREISLDSRMLLIEDKRLINGKWKVKIDWKYEEEEYLLKENIFY